jgi:hypothetical protein
MVYGFYRSVFCVLGFVFCVLFWRIVVADCLPVMLHTFLVPYPRFGGKHCNCEAKCKVFLRDCASFFWGNGKKRAKRGKKLRTGISRFVTLSKFVKRTYLYVSHEDFKKYNWYAKAYSKRHCQ